MHGDRTIRPFPRLSTSGDCAFRIAFGEGLDPAVNEQAVAYARQLRRLRWHGVGDVVPAFNCVTVYYDPLAVSASSLSKRLLHVAQAIDVRSCPGSRLVTIPVAYGEEFGPDLEAVARHAGCSPDQVVALHASAHYRVYMLGFSPGFPYLASVPEAIAIPRLSTPRTCVPAGSVGIAGIQTGIYPQASPGGWRLIGRTPMRLFDVSRSSPCLLRPGDRVRFRPISRRDYERFSSP
ncbi:5-oxoprolinase subunit PxpB [Candidatus Nitrospira bockiana]